MQPDALPAADWYADPERPDALRYWDGAQWTEHRAEPQPHTAPAPTSAAPGAPEMPAAPSTPPKPPRDPEESKFMVVVGLVLGGAAVLIAAIVLVVVWFDSYNNGHARGEEALERGVQPSEADAYCEDLATSTTTAGSAEGYWDMPWLWGCKRGLG